MIYQKHLTAAVPFSAVTIANLAGTSVDVPVPTARTTDIAIASLGTSPPLGVILSANVTSGDVVTVTLFNFSGATQTIPACMVRTDVF